jgi:predicted deacylase
MRSPYGDEMTGGLTAAIVLALALPGGAAAAPRSVLLGRSVDGRPIVAFELGDPHAARRVLVVGCIHGNEPAGIAVARRLEGTSTCGSFRC